jgi:eukaryotic-like serine/threonine-protein kinase
LNKLGKYEILAELGHGAMGIVYKARDPLIGRLVALKTINSNLVDRPDLLERFHQEAQSAGKLQHPNIVTVFELGQEKDTPFIAMEFVDGESLEKAILRQTELPLAMKVGYIVRICKALEYAHKNRVVHRDIKPGNIMVNSDGVVKVVDFGIARLVDFSRTHTNMMIGTPAYMAPELFRKKKADERTDIWAAGITFYELLCYQRPFSGEGYDIIRAIMEDDFPTPSSILPECPREVESVIQRMLRKQSAERYQSMEDVLLDLEPVWNRLRADAARVLSARAREFYELGDLTKAQDTLRRVRQIDHSNPDAKSLLEKITAEIRRTEIQPKVEQHMNRGRAFLQSGQFREARAEMEAALVLDSQHEPAQKLRAEIEAGAARAEQLEQKLRLTRQRLVEGTISEAESALRDVLELDPGNAQALELKRQIGEEQARREKRKQFGELLQRARTLWTELKYDECLAVITESLKTFPNEPELKNLQEAALADQAEQRKQVQVSEVRKLLGQQKLNDARKALDVLAKERPQDSTVRNLQALLAQEEQEQKRQKRLEEELKNLRGLASAGELKELVAKGEALLNEFPQAYEIKDLLTYAKGELAQQEQKRIEQEREKQIRALLEAQRYREAAEAARRAVQEFPKQELFRKFASEAEQKFKEQQEREEIQREIQQRIQEIRSKIKRQELTDAIDLARQTLATLGPDTDVAQLLHAAEVEAEERDRKTEERDRQLEAARGLVEKGAFAEARQVLDRAIANRVIQPTDMQARLLLSQIKQKEEALRKEAQKQAKTEEKSSSVREEKPPAGSAPTGPSITAIPPTAIAPVSGTFASGSATSFAAASARMKPSAPVMTPLPAVHPQPTAIPTEMRVDERVAQPEPAATGSVLRKPVVLVALALVVAGAVYAAIRFIPRWKSKPAAADVALEAEAQQLWNNHKFDDSLADWNKLADHSGALHDEAVKQVNDIEQKHVAVERLYAQGMKLLYEEKKYPEAAQKFNQVLQMNLWKMDGARREYDVASAGPGGASDKPLWQALFEEGKEAFDKKDYRTALQDLEQATQANGVSSDTSAQAQQLIPVIRDREAQKKDFEQAVAQERAGQKQQAKDLLDRAIKAPNGDPDLIASAKNKYDQLGMNSQPPNPSPNANPNANATPNPTNSSTDYGQVVEQVRGLINDTRWDDADAKLKDLPASQADFDDLKQQIDAGRRDDRDFSQAKQAFAQADASKDKNLLRAVRPFFMGEANRPGRHSGEARNIVNKIDADLGGAETAKTSARRSNGNAGKTANSPSDDAAAINAVLERYTKALDDGDLEAVKTVRQYSGKEESRLPELLKSIKGKGYALEDCFAPQINGDSATVNCDALFSKAKHKKPQRIDLWLSRISGQWIIVSSK